MSRVAGVSRCGQHARRIQLPIMKRPIRVTRAGGDDPLLRTGGMIDGLPSDLSAQFDRYLAETFVAEKPAPHAARPRRPRKTVRR
jgi:hypothetical protein